MDINGVPAMNEYPLSDLIEVASLKKLAVTKLALDLWRVNDPRKAEFKVEMYWDLTYFRSEEVLQVELPSSIKELIDDRICLWGQELHYMYKSFGRFHTLKYSEIIEKCFESFTYRPDGKLCAERTAKNLLASPELTAIQKFEIACVYWFEDEIKRFWHLIYHKAINSCSCNSSICYSEIFTRYWKTKMRNCETVSPETYNNYITSNHSNLQAIIRGVGTFRNWSAYVGLLNTICLTRQHYFLSEIFEHVYIYDTHYLLSKLNRVQVHFVLTHRLKEIITAIASDSDGFENIQKIWNIARDIIDGDYFFELLDYFFNEVYNSYRRKNYSFINLKKVREVLLEIWITAPNRLKNEFFEGHYMEELFDNIIAMYSTLPESCYFYDHIDEQFISNMFSDMPLEMRTEIWHFHWPGVVIHSSAEFQNHLLRLCLKEDDFIRFVEEEMLNFTKVEAIIQNWWAMELYERIINYSKLCSWNNQLAREFRNKIFSSSIPSSLNIFNYDKLTKLKLAIDNCLTNAEEAKDVKRMIFFSEDVQNGVEY